MRYATFAARTHLDRITTTRDAEDVHRRAPSGHGGMKLRGSKQEEALKSGGKPATPTTSPETPSLTSTAKEDQEYNTELRWGCLNKTCESGIYMFIIFIQTPPA